MTEQIVVGIFPQTMTGSTLGFHPADSTLLRSPIWRSYVIQGRGLCAVSRDGSTGGSTVTKGSRIHL